MSRIEINSYDNDRLKTRKVQAMLAELGVLPAAHSERPTFLKDHRAAAILIDRALSTNPLLERHCSNRRDLAGAANAKFAEAFGSQSDGSGFEWNPIGVTFGIDFTTDRIFDGTTVTDDYSVVLGAADFGSGPEYGLDPAAISASGMALFNNNGNYPYALGDLLTKLETLDFTLVFFWRQVQLFNGNYLMRLYSADRSTKAEMYHDSSNGSLFVSDFNGDYNVVGSVRGFSDNVLAVSHSPAGWLSSLNGAAAVLDPTATAVIGQAAIGFQGGGTHGSNLEGWLKALIFYPATDAAGVEAYSANAAPANSVAPAITGTAQVGQQLSVSTGAWTGAPTSYEYQWYRGNFNIGSKVAGATLSTFTPTVDEQGQTMKCVVYAVNADGISGIAVSDDEVVAAE